MLKQQCSGTGPGLIGDTRHCGSTHRTGLKRSPLFIQSTRSQRQPTNQRRASSRSLRSGPVRHARTSQDQLPPGHARPPQDLNFRTHRQGARRRARQTARESEYESKRERERECPQVCTQEIKSSVDSKCTEQTTLHFKNSLEEFFAAQVLHTQTRTCNPLIIKTIQPCGHTPNYTVANLLGVCLKKD